MAKYRFFQKIVHWLLAALAAVLLITGLGITEYGIVESLSFRWLTKSVAHRIHTADAFWVAFVVLLALHICLSLLGRARNKRSFLQKPAAIDGEKEINL